MTGGCRRTIQVYKPSEAISQAQIVSGSCPDQAHDVVSSTGGMDDGDGDGNIHRIWQKSVPGLSIKAFMDLIGPS